MFHRNNQNDADEIAAMQAEFADTNVSELVETEPTQVENSRLIIYIIFVLEKYLFVQLKKQRKKTFLSN